MKWRIKPDQSALIGCDEEGVVSEWTGDQYDRPRELFQLGPGFYRGSLSLDASKLAVGYQDGKVELWDIERQERIRSLDLGGGALLPDQFYANDQIVEVMSEGYWGSKFLWDIRRNRKMFDWSHTDNLISLDGTVGVSFYDGQIEMTDFSGAAPATLPEHWSKSFPFGRVAISPNGRLLGTVDPSRTVQIFDLQQRKTRHADGHWISGRPQLRLLLTRQPTDHCGRRLSLQHHHVRYGKPPASDNAGIGWRYSALGQVLARRQHRLRSR